MSVSLLLGHRLQLLQWTFHHHRVSLTLTFLWLKVPYTYTRYELGVSKQSATVTQLTVINPAIGGDYFLPQALSHQRQCILSDDRGTCVNNLPAVVV